MSRRKVYPPQQLETAVVMVASGSMSATKAAKVYGVPRRTIGDRVAKITKKKNEHDS
jgi:hypothetical protein